MGHSLSIKMAVFVFFQSNWGKQRHFWPNNGASIAHFVQLIGEKSFHRMIALGNKMNYYFFGTRKIWGCSQSFRWCSACWQSLLLAAPTALVLKNNFDCIKWYIRLPYILIDWEKKQWQTLGIAAPISRLHSNQVSHVLSVENHEKTQWNFDIKSHIVEI